MDEGYAGLRVRVVVVDLVLMLAQFFEVNDAGARLRPVSAPIPCRDAAETGLRRILANRGFL